MSSVAEIVTRALRLVGVQDSDEAPSASSMQTGIEALNAMCARIEADGIPMGWAPVAGPADPMPTPPEMDEPLAYLLASLLADDFRVQLSERVQMRAEAGLGKIHADALLTEGARLDYNLPGNAAGGRLAGFLSGR